MQCCLEDCIYQGEHDKEDIFAYASKSEGTMLDNLSYCLSSDRHIVLYCQALRYIDYPTYYVPEDGRGIKN